MENSSRTLGQNTYSDKQIWRAWSSSDARKQHINTLLADGCTPAGANRQADFDFEAHTQIVDGKRASPAEEIASFQDNINEMELLNLWSNSNTRVKHITHLLIIGFSNEGAVAQADVDFKAHSSGFAGRKSTPEAEIESFEKYTNDQTLKNIWKSSHVRKTHIEDLRTNGASPNGASKQADIDFHHLSQELAKTDISADQMIEAFEEYFHTILGASDESLDKSINEAESLAGFKLSERDEAKRRDNLWMHLCHRAGLEPREVIGEFDRTLNFKNEKREVEDFLDRLTEKFLATGVTEEIVEIAIRAFKEFVGLD